MADLTAVAVQRQVEAMGCDRFEIGVYDARRETMLIKQWDKETVLRSIDYFRAQNVNGKHIYIRPAGEHALSLVDDLTKDGVEQMKRDGIAPALVVETSPKNFQAWVNHGQPLPTDLSTECAKELARRYGGDPSSADWRHFGRLAGFTNCKPKHKLDSGYFPFVIVREATGETYPKAGELIQTARDTIQTREREEAERREQWRNAPQSQSRAGARKSINDFRNDPKFQGDYHRADMSYAVYAVSRGVSDHEIEGAIRSRDLSHKGGEARQRDYIQRTIDGARKFAQNKGIER